MPEKAAAGAPRGAWIMIGFALGGFFDGILLHQILQWHHLLSGLEAARDIRFQVMADGLFHLAMYVLALAGVTMILLRPARERGSSRAIVRLLMLGFGSWHVLDALLSHFLLGIHRIRMDSDMPLLWDLAFLAVFGLLPLVLAWRMPVGGGNASRAMIAGSITLTIGAGLAAALPASGDSGTMVVFRPGLAPAARMDAVARAGATLRWSDTTDTVLLLDGIGWPETIRLYAAGAMLVGTSPLTGGCLAATRPVPA